MDLHKLTIADKKIITKNKFLRIALFSMLLFSLLNGIAWFYQNSFYNEQIKSDKIKQKTINEASDYLSFISMEIIHFLNKDYPTINEQTIIKDKVNILIKKYYEIRIAIIESDKNSNSLPSLVNEFRKLKNE